MRLHNPCSRNRHGREGKCALIGTWAGFCVDGPLPRILLLLLVDVDETRVNTGTGAGSAVLQCFSVDAVAHGEGRDLGRQGGYRWDRLCVEEQATGVGHPTLPVCLQVNHGGGRGSDVTS